MLEASGAHVKEMESAAIAWVCSQYNVAYTALKVPTDYCDTNEDKVADFLDNLKKASIIIAETLSKITDLIANKRLSEFE